MVSRIEPRKGHLQVLNTFNLLWSEGFDLNLIIVGRTGWMVEKLINTILDHPEYGKKLIWLQNASDELLKKLYVKQIYRHLCHDYRRYESCTSVICMLKKR